MTKSSALVVAFDQWEPQIRRAFAHSDKSNRRQLYGQRIPVIMMNESWTLQAGNHGPLVPYCKRFGEFACTVKSGTMYGNVGV